MRGVWWACAAAEKARRERMIMVSYPRGRGVVWRNEAIYQTGDFIRLLSYYRFLNRAMD